MAQKKLPGKPPVEIAPTGNLLFDLADKSKDVDELRRGIRVRIKFDAYDFQICGTLTGKVAFIMAESQVPSQPQESSSAIYKVKVELDGTRLGRGEFQGRIKLGMTGSAERRDRHRAAKAAAHPGAKDSQDGQSVNS